MSALKISLMGVIRVFHRDIPAEFGMGQAVKRLLGYLAIFRHRFHAREVLAGIFWGESREDRARSSLSTTLWRLRKILEPDPISKGAYIVTTPTGEIGFNCNSDYWIDVESFEKQLKSLLSIPYGVMRREEMKQLEDSLRLYRGELMEGFYDDWALRERERLRALFIKGQIQLLYYFSHHDKWEQGLACAQNILNMDPLREEIHREMMRLYYKCGQRTLALKQYERCCEILASELDVEPIEETQILNAQILQNSGKDMACLDAQLDLISARSVLKQLKKNIVDFERSTARLKISANSLEDVIKNGKHHPG